MREQGLLELPVAPPRPPQSQPSSPGQLDSLIPFATIYEAKLPTALEDSRGARPGESPGTEGQRLSSKPSPPNPEEVPGGRLGSGGVGSAEDWVYPKGEGGRTGGRRNRSPS